MMMVIIINSCFCNTPNIPRPLEWVSINGSHRTQFHSGSTSAKFSDKKRIKSIAVIYGTVRVTGDQATALKENQAKSCL